MLPALYLQSLPCQTVNLNGLLRDLLHRQEVPVVPARFFSILEPQDCYLNWLVVLEALRLAVQHVKVLLVPFLDFLLKSLHLLLLLLLHRLRHLAEWQALLLTGPHVYC